MDKLIREDYVLGNKKIVVGDNLHDLVLENLGKIWVRYGNGYKEFSQFVSTLAKATTSISKVVIEPNRLQSVDSYKSGQLVFDARKKNLYLKYEESLLLLLEYNDDLIEKYVAKAGDTMTGMLTIEVLGGSPLKVNSAELVKNLNANYLEGKKADNFTLKAKDEEITGNWTFLGNDNHNGLNTFNNKVIINGELEENSTSKFAGKATFNNEIEVARTATFKLAGGTAIRVGTGDIVTDGSIGSSQFMSGMTGYGWRLDANTNTLTIDNLIVRGVLNVFELIVNKISATNGSLWITDSFKINKTYEVEYLNRNTLTVSDENSLNSLMNKFSEDKYFVVYGNNNDNRFTTTLNPFEHPFIQNEQVELFTFDKFRRIFKINNLKAFKSIFSPEIIPETIGQLLFETTLKKLFEVQLEEWGFLISLDENNNYLFNNIYSTQKLDNINRISFGERKGYLLIYDGQLYIVDLSDLDSFTRDHPLSRIVSTSFVSDSSDSITLLEDVIIPETTVYNKDLTILTDAQLISLNNSGVITLSNMFLRSPENVFDMEVLDNEHTINPWAETSFEDCKFTIIDASRVSLQDGKYIYDSDAIARINLYCKYFGASLSSDGIGDSNMRTWVLECDHNEFPVFKPGDILKCQKFDVNNIKQYHALVLGLADNYSYIVQLQNYSVVQEGTTLSYDVNGNLNKFLTNLDTTLYDRSLGLTYSLEDYSDRARDIISKYADDITSQTDESLTWALQVLINPEDISNYNILDNPTLELATSWANNVLQHQIDELSYEDCLNHPIFKKAFGLSTISVPTKDDSLVRIGSIMYSDRRNSMYLTSSELNSPYTDVLVGVNRPDYSVLYLTPKYVKFEATDTDRKGLYYLQDDVFGNIMEQGNNNTGNDKVIYDKYKNFVIKHDITSEGETNLQKTFVKLTFLSDENTLHNLDGSLMTLNVESVDYFVSSANSNIINNTSFVNEDVKSVQIILDLNTISLTIGRGGASNTFDGLLDVGILDIKREDDSIFILQGNNISVNLLPALRTNSNNIYDDENYPVSVIVTETIFTDSGSSEKYYPIKYNSNYTLSLNNVRSKKIKITFTVGGIELRKTIQFYILPNSLYEKYFGEGNDYNTFSVSEYNSVIDALTGNPVISKYGCLLLTNEYDVIETVEIEGNIKGLAELIPTTKVRMGNLNGIYNETFGTNQPRGFGLYGESVYLTGNFYLNNGKSLVDISNDITLAVGNINRILNTLNNLKATLLDSIYNLTVSTTTSFSQAISENKDAIFKLGKDYSLWAVGNAGISIINPNVKYDSNGNVDDSTVGDGDEYIFMQGESVQIATSISKDNNNETYFRVIVCTSSPQGFKYNDNDLYRPYIDNNTRPSFYVGWINKNIFNSATKINVNLTETTKLFRYVALNKHLNSGQIQIANALDTLSLDNHDFYSFSISREIDGSDIYQDDNFNNTFAADYNYYVIKDVVISGMFEDGKFNTNLIEVKNLLAIDLASRDGSDLLIYKKNPNFNIDQEISNTNYPVLYTDNSAIATDAPFVVVSGTTGKITAQGMQIKEATIGDISGEHIRISDNLGISVSYNDGLSIQSDTKPAIYFKNGEDVIVKVSSDNGKQVDSFFENTEENYNLEDITFYNEETYTSSRQLSIVRDNKEPIGEINNSYFYIKLNNDEDFKASNIQGEGYSGKCYVKRNGIFTNILDPLLYDGEIIYVGNSIDFSSSFIPARTKAYMKLSSNTYQPFFSCYNSDIGKILYSNPEIVGSNLDIKVFDINLNNTRTLELSFNANKTYEISGTFDANIEENNIFTASNPNAVLKYIEGGFKLILSLLLINISDSNDIIPLKDIIYLKKCSKSYKNSYEQIKTYNENDRQLSQNLISSNVILKPEMINLTLNDFGFIKFSKIHKFEQSGTYKLNFKASVEFKLEGKLSLYKYKDEITDNSIIPPNPGDTDDESIINPGHNISPIIPYIDDDSEYCVYSNDYLWNPLDCPETYTIKPKIEIENFNFNKILIKDKTIIQQNGFLSGYNINNYLGLSFNDVNNFSKSEFVNGIGTILNNNGLFNAFRFSDGLRIIKLPIPILYGSIVSKTTTSVLANNESYKYYIFTGYSLFNNNKSNFGGPAGDSYMTSIFTTTYETITVGRFTLRGCMYYMNDYDIYLSSSLDCSILRLFFGETWKKLFNLYGSNIFVSINPKHLNLVYNTYIYHNKTFSYIKFKKHPSFKDNLYTVDENEDYTYVTSPLSLLFHCYHFYSGTLTLSPASFDITVNYIPDLS